MTDFGKGKAGIDAVTKKAEAKGFERLCQYDGGSLKVRQAMIYSTVPGPLTES